MLHREVAEPRAALLVPGAVLLLRAVSCFSAAGQICLNVVPAALTAFFPNSTVFENGWRISPDWRGLDSYVRVPTRPKRPSSSRKRTLPAPEHKALPAPEPPERQRQVAAARQALLRIPAVPSVVARRPATVPTAPAAPAAPAAPEQGWGEAEDAILLEYARLAEAGALSRSAIGLPNSLSASSSLSPAWNDEDDALLLELDLDALAPK